MALSFPSTARWGPGSPVDLSFAHKNNASLWQASCLVFGFVLRKRFEGLKGRNAYVVGLTEFDADKTMRLLDKVWEKRPDKEQKGNNPRLADFPVNRDFNDKHGHRIAFPGDKGLQPVLNVMRSFDKRSLVSAKTFTKHEVEKQWGQIKLLEPQVSAASLSPLIRNGLLDESDISFLEKFGEACGVLEEEEIIALGRHETAEGTRTSLLWELDRWHKATLEALSALTGHVELDRGAADRAWVPIWQCWSFALECKRKAGLLLHDDPYGADRNTYANGFRKLRAAIGHDEGLKALDEAQRPPEKIWDNPLVSTLAFPAFCCWSFANYFAGTLRELDVFNTTPLRQRLSSVTREHIEKAFHNTRRFVRIPRSARPADFSLGWRDSVGPMSEGGLAVDIAPDSVWNRSATLTEFVDGARSVATWLADNYVLPDILDLYKQEA